MFLGNLDKIDTKKHFQTSDIFVNEILRIWAEVNFSKKISLQHYKTQRLKNNSLIRIDRKPVYFREWLAKGISTIESLIKDNTRFLSYTEFLNKYHCQSCPNGIGFCFYVNKLNINLASIQLQDTYLVMASLAAIPVMLAMCSYFRNTFRTEWSCSKTGY